MDKLDDKERTRLRQQALEWLRSELSARAKQLDTGKPGDRTTVRDRMRHWQRDIDLASIRDKASLNKLAADEQKSFNQLRVDVAELLKKSEE